MGNVYSDVSEVFLCSASKSSVNWRLKKESNLFFNEEPVFVEHLSLVDTEAMLSQEQAGSPGNLSGLPLYLKGTPCLSSQTHRPERLPTAPPAVPACGLSVRPASSLGSEPSEGEDCSPFSM